jgi:hypothetical protein
VTDTALVYSSSGNAVSHFDPVVKVSNTRGAAADYAPSDYRLYYRDGLDIFVLKWTGAKRPALGATFYVSMTSGEGTALATSHYAVSGTSVTLALAPAANEAVFASLIGQDYEQTGNLMGGVSSVTPDGPGYQMRTFNPGLAFGFDLLYDYSGLTAELKAEFVGVLNGQIDWYKAYGYEKEGDLGNYFIRGLLTGAMFTAYGTEGANARSAELKTLADGYIRRPFTKLDLKLPGGYGPQGQYANGVATDILQVFTLYRGLTGQDLLSQLAWTSAIIPATIHATKPDRKTFYDGGDWDDLPAVPLADLVNSFLTYLPDHPMAPYGRQLLTDMGQTPPSGAKTDYKTSFPTAYFAKVSGPIYARSEWSTAAVWVSLSAGEIFMDHQHLDQGHVTIQRGADYLLCDGGGYGDLSTTFHNTLLFDDKGAGDLITYPPGQGYWGRDRTGIRGFEQTESYVYGLADFGWAYAQGSEGARSAVTTAQRSMVYIRPDVTVIHDRTRTANANVKKYVNWNFGAAPEATGGVYAVTKGASKLFMKPLLPASATPVITPITETGQPIAKSNYRVMATGRQDDDFLHVFQATASSSAAMNPVVLLNGPAVEGAEVDMGDTTWVTVFSKTDSVLTGAVSYPFAAIGKQKHVVTDLARGMQYKVSAVFGGQSAKDSEVLYASPAGVISFTFAATDTGHVVLVPTGVISVKAGFSATARTIRVEAFVKNGIIAVRFGIDREGPVAVRVMDLSGRQLAGMGIPDLQKGNHTVQFGMKGKLRPGMYVVWVERGGRRDAAAVVAER